MQHLGGLVLAAATWLLLCRQAGRLPRGWALLLDTGSIGLTWLLFLAISARPIASGIVVAGIGIGLAVTDAVKRATLREPLVFADRAELLEVVRHPELYLPFAGPVRIVAGAASAVIAAAALLWFEPPVAHPPVALLVAVAACCVFLPGWPPLLHRLARAYRSLGVTGDPATDSARLGFVACLVIHATLARSERAGRRGAIAPFPGAPRPGGPIVLVQIESFFDARRLGPGLPSDILPAYDRMLGGALQSGQLAVPCWGANTVRTEFTVLTGIGAEALGLDRFNPYERFARQRIRSLAWQMKQAGYRTICLHPFDKGFYSRDRVLPLLGFDEFQGPEVFGGGNGAGRYVTDVAVSEQILRIVREQPRVFVFAITMGNHGPWDAPGGALARYLEGLRASDCMLAPLLDGFPDDGLLAVYGDHQPSLAADFAACGFTDERTDYALWRPYGVKGRDVPLGAEQLAGVLLRETGSE